MLKWHAAGELTAGSGDGAMWLKNDLRVPERCTIIMDNSAMTKACCNGGANCTIARLVGVHGESWLEMQRGIDAILMSQIRRARVGALSATRKSLVLVSTCSFMRHRRASEPRTSSGLPVHSRYNEKRCHKCRIHTAATDTTAAMRRTEPLECCIL